MKFKAKQAMVASALGTTLILATGSGAAFGAQEPIDADVNRTYYGDWNGDGAQDTARLKDFGDWKGVQSCGVEFTLHDGTTKLIKYSYDNFEPNTNMLRCFEGASIQTVDLNGDGRQELAVWWTVDGYRPPQATMAILGLDGKHDVQANVGAHPDERLVFADLNGDGRSDLVATTWIANVGEDAWTPKTHEWHLTGVDGEPGVGTKYTARGSGISIADIDPTTPGEELIVPHGIGKTNLDGDFITEKCEIQVVRGGTAVTRTELKDLQHCNPESSNVLDTDRDGRIDTLEVTWVNETTGPVTRHKTRHRFDDRGRFVEGSPANPNPPVANRDYVKMSFQWGLEGRIPVLANDKHAEGGKLSIVRGPQHGTATVDGDRIVYTRTRMKRGWDSLTYRVTAPNGKSATAKLRIQMVGTPPHPDPNVLNEAKNDRVKMYPGKFEMGDINVLRNDKVYGVVKVSIDSAPRIGTAVALDNGRIRYDRRGKGYGTDRFTYTVTDPKGRSSTATVVVETPRGS